MGVRAKWKKGAFRVHAPARQVDQRRPATGGTA